MRSGYHAETDRLGRRPFKSENLGIGTFARLTRCGSIDRAMIELLFQLAPDHSNLFGSFNSDSRDRAANFQNRDSNTQLGKNNLLVFFSGND